MAWSYEAKTGVGWAIVILVLMLIVVGLEISAREVLLLFLLVPIVVYIGFVAWVYRIKK